MKELDVLTTEIDDLSADPSHIAARTWEALDQARAHRAASRITRAPADYGAGAASRVAEPAADRSPTQLSISAMARTPVKHPTRNRRSLSLALTTIVTSTWVTCHDTSWDNCPVEVFEIPC
jgi:hypothetical protein